MLIRAAGPARHGSGLTQALAQHDQAYGLGRATRRAVCPAYAQSYEINFVPDQLEKHACFNVSIGMKSVKLKTPFSFLNYTNKTLNRIKHRDGHKILNTYRILTI